VTLVVFLLGRIRRFKRRYDAWGVRRGIAAPPAGRQVGASPARRPDGALDDPGRP
jgi:hypothetical protein